MIENDDKLVYDHVIEENLSKGKIIKYLYKGGPSRGVDLSPSSLIPENASSTFESRVFRWFTKKKKDSDFLNNIFRVLEENKESEENKGIIPELNEKYENIDSKEKTNVLLTLSIEGSDGERKYIGDYDIFREIILEDSSKRYYFLKSIGESKGKGKCYLCNAETEVYGFVPNAFGFSFSNADKKGNVPSFIQTDQWKQVPICGKCAIYLEAGKKFVEESLSFKMFNTSYFIIPQFLFEGNTEHFDEFNETVKYYHDEVEEDSKNTKKYEEGLLSEEDYLNKTMKNMGDVLELKFLFYKPKPGGKYIDITNYIESVLPSWVRELEIAQEKVKTDILFSEDNMNLIFGGNTDGNFIVRQISQKNSKIGINNWYAGFLRNFFPYKQDNSFIDKTFLELVGRIIAGNPLNPNFLISSFMGMIRRAHRRNVENDYYMKILVIESLMLYMFLNELNLLKGVDKMNIGSESEKYNDKDFFEVYGELIDAPDKKASFLMGILTKKLTSTQYMALGSTPFMTKLWGMSLDQKKLQKLYPLIINKLREYKKAYVNLEEQTSINLLESSKNWNLSRDETSFYFVLGFTLAKMFQINKKEKEGDLNE